jgi:hypothetical protein
MAGDGNNVMAMEETLVIRWGNSVSLDLGPDCCIPCSSRYNPAKSTCRQEHANLLIDFFALVEGIRCVYKNGNENFKAVLCKLMPGNDNVEDLR